MDIETVLKNKGIIVPNPNYNSKTKKEGASPYTISTNARDDVSLASTVNKQITPFSFNLAHLGKAEDYTDYGVTPNPIDSPESLNKQRAENQSAFEQLGHSLAQAVIGEGLLGIAEGFSNLADAGIEGTGWLINKVAEKTIGKTLFDEPNDYTNPISSQFEEWKEQLRKATPIYMKDQNATMLNGGMLDFGWWMSNAPSVMSSVSMLIPARANSMMLAKIGKGARALTKATKADAIVNKIANKTRAGRFMKAAAIEGTTANAIVDTGITAGTSRILENYQESAQVYKNTYEKANQIFDSPDFDKEQFIRENTDKDGNFAYSNRQNEDGSIDWNGIAKDISNQAANRDFVWNLGNFFNDFLQVYALRNFAKGFKDKFSSATLRTENEAAAKSLGKSAAELAENATTKAKLLKQAKNFGLGTKEVIGAEFSEGVEEMLNYVAEQEGLHLGNVLLGDEVDNNFDYRLGQYLRDGKFWDSAFWGVIGGVVFQGLGSGINKLGNKILKNDEINEIEDRKLEILSRSYKMEDIKRRMEILEKGYDIYNPKDKKEVPENSTKPSDLYNKFDAKDKTEEAQMIVQAKKRLMDDALSDLIINAAAEGNLGLLKTYLNDENVQQFLKESKIDETENLDNWNRYVNNIIDRVETKMDDVITYLDDLDVPAPYIRMIAVNNVNAQLQTENLEGMIATAKNEIQDYIRGGHISIDENTIGEYARGIKAEVVADYLRNLKDHRRQLKKMKTISAAIGLANVEEQIAAVEKIVNEEFAEFADLKDYITYQSEKSKTQKGTSKTDESQAFRDKWIEEHRDPNLTLDEGLTAARLAFDKLAKNNSYSTLASQNEGLARAYSALANEEIALAISKDSIKLDQKKVAKLVQEYDGMFDRAKRKASNEASKIIRKMFDKYDADQVYKHIENAENEVEGISDKDLRTLDDAIKAMTLLDEKGEATPGSSSYLMGIRRMALEAELAKKQDEEINGPNEDDGSQGIQSNNEGADSSTGGTKFTFNPKFKKGDKIIYNNKEYTLETDPKLITGSQYLYYEYAIRDGNNIQYVSEDALKSPNENLPFGNNGGQTHLSKEEELVQKILNRPWTQADENAIYPGIAAAVVRNPDSYEYNEHQPGDIVVDNKGNRLVIISGYENQGSIKTYKVAELSKPDSSRTYGYEQAETFGNAIVQNENRDSRIQSRALEEEAERQQLLDAPELRAWDYATEMVKTIPRSSDGTLTNENYENIYNQVKAKLISEGVDTNDAHNAAMKAVVDIQQYFTGGMASAVAELVYTKSFTQEYRLRVRDFIDKFIDATGIGSKIGNRRYINLQALLRYAKTHGANSNLVNKAFYDLRDFLIQENNKEGNRMFVLLDNIDDLFSNDFLDKTDLTVEEANRLELENTPSHRVDINTLITTSNIAEFNKAFNSLNPGDEIEYEFTDKDILLKAVNGVVVGRLPIVKIDSDKSSRNYGAYVQANDGWITDLKPVSGRIQSRFISWLKDNLSDRSSDLFNYINIWSTAQLTDDQKKDLINKIKQTEAWKQAVRRNFIVRGTEDEVLINGLSKLFSYNSNSANADEFRANYDHWAKKLLNSYSSVESFVNGEQKAKGKIVIDRITEGRAIRVEPEEADVPSKTIQGINHQIHKIASYRPTMTNVNAGIDISGNPVPLTEGVGSLIASMRSGRSFIVLPNRSGSPTLVQTYPVTPSEVTSEGGKNFIRDIKNEMYLLMQRFAQTGAQEDFNKLVQFVNKVFPVVGNEDSAFQSKYPGTHRGLTSEKWINIDLGANKFVIHRQNNNGGKTTIFKIGNQQIALTNQGIINGINQIFDNLVIHIENEYVKNDSMNSRFNIGNGLFNWRNGKLYVTTRTGTKEYDSYNQFMIDNDLMKCRTKIVNNSNFEKAKATVEDGKIVTSQSMKVKLVTGDTTEQVEVPTTDISEKVKKIFSHRNGNKSRQILRAIFPNSKVLNNVLSLPIFEENINFADTELGAFGVTLTKDQFIGDRLFLSGDIVYGREFLREIAADPNRAGLDIIHENLHKQLIDPRNRRKLQNIKRIYDEYLDSLNNEENLRKYSEKIGTPVEEIRNFFNNMTNAIQNYETEDEIIEEFLVQSLTNRTLVDYLNNVEASDYVKDDKHMTLWQKILKFVGELFGANVEEGSLREKEYYALSDLFEDTGYELKNRTNEEVKTEETHTVQEEQVEEETPAEETPVTPRPTPRRGGRRGGMLSSVGEIQTPVINIESYVQSFPEYLQPEIERLKQSGTLNFVCS